MERSPAIQTSRKKALANGLQEELPRLSGRDQARFYVKRLKCHYFDV